MQLDRNYTPIAMLHATANPVDQLSGDGTDASSSGEQTLESVAVEIGV